MSLRRDRLCLQVQAWFLRLLILGLAIRPEWVLAREGKHLLSGALPGIGVLQPAGEVVVADDFEQQVGMVRRFTGLNPRQDWQHVLATRGQYLWQRFYLSPVSDALQWPRGRQIELVLRDSSRVRSGEIFVVTPDERRVPTLLGRGEAPLDTHELLRHDSKALVVYAGFPVRAKHDSVTVAWQFSDVIAIR